MERGNITFTIIKPLAVKEGHIGEILTLIERAGFSIKALKMTLLTKEKTAKFYADHLGKPFYEKLINFISSGPIVAVILEKENAVEDFRKLIGSTDPAQAEEGTIRKLFAKDKTYNAIHGADSDENALKESNFFFSVIEQ